MEIQEAHRTVGLIELITTMYDSGLVDGYFGCDLQLSDFSIDLCNFFCDCDIVKFSSVLCSCC